MTDITKGPVKTQEQMAEEPPEVITRQQMMEKTEANRATQTQAQGQDKAKKI